MRQKIKSSLLLLMMTFIFGCNKAINSHSLPPSPPPVEPTTNTLNGCTISLSNPVLEPLQNAIAPVKLSKKAFTTLQVEDPLAQTGEFYSNEFLITLSSRPVIGENSLLSATRLNEILTEQKNFLILLKKLDPNAKVANTHTKLTNSILVVNLSEAAAKEIQKRGFDIRRNEKVKFQGIDSMSAFVLAPDFITLPTLIQKIGAGQAHLAGTKGNNITIGFIDSGAQISHPEFQGRIISGKGYCGDQSKVSDSIGHGTHVTSIAAGNSGIAPETNIRIYQVACLGVDGILSALEDAVADGVRIINMSFSMRDGSAVIEAINNAVKNYNVVVVAATGNCDYKAGPCEGTTAQGRISPIDLKHIIGAPGSVKFAITVGASNAEGIFSQLLSLTGPAVLGGTSRFQALAKPDLIAPGLNICAAGSDNVEAVYAPGGATVYINGKAGFFGWCDSTHAVLSGSSMSAPVVSGAVALIMGARPDWNAEEIKSAIKLSANQMNSGLGGFSIFDTGQGQLHVQGALDILGKPPVSRFDEVEYEIGSLFSVSGSAYDRDTDSKSKLKEFRVYAGKGRNPTDFKLLKSFSGEVKNGKLFNTSISNCTPGEYLFKLEVEDFSGQVSRDFALINYSPQL